MDNPVTHYPVTQSFWRGVWDASQIRGRRPVLAACTWRPIAPPDSSTLEAPTCHYCWYYRHELIRLGKITAFKNTVIPGARK